MLHIVLLILKIIGIILAVIIGLIVLSLLAVLFVPIRYSGYAEYYNKIPDVRFKVTWLLHFLTVRGAYKGAEHETADGEELSGKEESGFKMRVKLLNFTLYPKKADKPGKKADSLEKKADKPEKKDIKPAGKNQKKHAPEKDITDAEKANVFDDSGGFVKPEEEHGKIIPDKPEAEQENNNKDEASESKKSFIDKIKERVKKIIALIKEFILKIKNFFINVNQKRERAAAKLRELSDKLTNPENRELAVFLWGEAKKVLKLLKPKKFKGYIHFGTGDPQTTGKIAMYAAVAYGFLGLDLKIRPDFENEALEGDLYLKGHFCLFGIAAAALRVYTNELFKKIILKK